MTDNIDEKDFHVPASDAKGHSTRIWARLSPDLDRQLATVFESKNFPYKSQGDLVRHAIVRHLAWLETISPLPLPSHLRRIEAVNELLREEESASDFEGIFHRLQIQVNGFVGSQNLVQAQSLISRVRHQITEMPESEWKQRYLQRLDREFGYLVNNGTPVDLSELV